MKRCLRYGLLSLALLAYVGLGTGCDDSSSRGADTSASDTANDTTAGDTTVTPDVVTPDGTGDGAGDSVAADVETDQVACTSDCTEVDALLCDGQAVLQCTDDIHDGCFEWVTLLSCGAGTVCADGTCVIPTCDNQPCTTPGAKQCGTNNDVETCADLDRDGCLEWSPGVACAGTLTCSNGLCVTECTNACTAIGAKDCDASGNIVTCGDYDGDDCLEWGNPLPCATDLVCTLGQCASTCSSSCTTVGARQCNAAGAVVECGNFNADSCLEWGSAVPCDAPLVCAAGNCASTCSDACAFANERQCVAGNSDQFQICGDYNNDGCLEWGTPESCGGALVCSGAGTCASTCSDSCPAIDDVRCSGDAVQTCDDYNNDSCIEWGTPVACAGFEVCAAGVCTQDTPQEVVIISELLYNSAGSPDSESFVELYGPVGTNLSGYSLVGVNGSTGADYVTIPLAGVIDSSQLFVIAHPNATGATAAAADMTHSGVDLQNGPDSLQLRYGALLVDAVAYGTFGASDIAAGEGTPAVGAGIDESLSRDASFSDTDDNFTDFKVAAAPTPGTSTTANGAPNAVLSCPAAGTTAQSLSFDASGSTDDGSIVTFGFNFGDGSPASSGASATTSHTFATANTFTVTLTVTDDGGQSDTATCNVVISAPNNPPVANLSCPASGTVGQQLTVDGSGSTDDGSIVTYRFDFGDGTAAVTGAASSANHTYTSASTYTVSLTVTDNSGLASSKTCMIPVADGQGPTVNFIKPIDNKQVTQGELAQILVDVTPAPGRSITQVEFFVGGASLGIDTGAPYEIDYTVPSSAATSSLIPIVAQATDDLGAVGISETRNLFVWNDAPQASFVALVTGALEVTADASSVSDTETPKANLEVRWDFENDGTWDTAWSTTKVTTHTYGGVGTYTINLEVRDATSQTDSITHDVTLSLLQNVSGSVTTTTWAGTIVITGDVTVPAGNTLTISEGTTIQVVATDQDVNGVGDYDIVVGGSLVVNGTATNPVVFTTFGSGDKTPRAWNKLRLTGSGHVIHYAIIEYADVGLEIAGSADIANTEVRMSRVGVSLLGSSNTTWTGGAIHDNSQAGIMQSAGTFAGDGVQVHDNGFSGVSVTGGTMNFTNGVVNRNGHCGFEYVGGGNGTVTRTLITTNDYEGVCIGSHLSVDPNPIFNFNNIYGNAQVGARVLAAPYVTASSSASGSGTVTSSPWSAPGGARVDFIYSSYSETDSSTNYINGYVRKTNASGVALDTASTARGRWMFTKPNDVTAIVTQVTDTTSSYHGDMTLAYAAYDEPGATREVSVLTNTTVVNLKHNYWGAFPNVLNVMTLGGSNDADIQGFMGVPFDATWQKGPYVGGESLAGDTNWSGTIYVTGDLAVPTATTLTIAQNTQVEFAAIDQNNDGAGDYSIEVAGALIVDGASLYPVTFTTYGALKAPNDWHRVHVLGTASSSNITYAIFEYGKEGLNLGTGAHSVADSTFAHMGDVGLQLNGASNVSLTNVTTKDNVDRGLRIASSSGVTIDRLTSQTNGGDGVSVAASTNQLSMANSTIANNGGDGVAMDASSLSISQSTVSGNRYGVKYLRSAQGSLTSSNVKFNQREGIALFSNGNMHPNPIVTGNNIYGNSVGESGVLVDPGLTVTSSSAGSGTVTSAPWSPPGGKLIEFLEYAYSETDSSTNYISGYVRRDSATGAQLVGVGSGMKHYQAITLTDLTAIVTQVTDTTSSYNGTMAVTHVLYYDAATNIELVALNDTGTINCTGNYWGVFPGVLARMTLTRTNSVDVQGFQVAELSGTGPQ